jgi:hypothetical protein
LADFGTPMKLDWDGHVQWEVEDTMHHDFAAPNGNTMVLGWEPVPTIWCHRSKAANQAPRATSGAITPGDHAGASRRWEWHGYEHLDVETDTICPLDQRHEWTHANTVKCCPMATYS